MIISEQKIFKLRNTALEKHNFSMWIFIKLTNNTIEKKICFIVEFEALTKSLSYILFILSILKTKLWKILSSENYVHYSFRNLKNLLQDENEIIFFSWQNAYQFCRFHHQHVNDALKTVLNDSLEDTKIESVNDKEELEKIQEKELFNKRNSQKDEKSCSLENKLNNRAQDLNHHWLEN
jgi:hypothetical protein